MPDPPAATSPAAPCSRTTETGWLSKLTWSCNAALPLPGSCISMTNTSMTFFALSARGLLVVPAAGNYTLSLSASGPARLTIDSRVVRGLTIARATTLMVPVKTATLALAKGRRRVLVQVGAAGTTGQLLGKGQGCSPVGGCLQDIPQWRGGRVGRLRTAHGPLGLPQSAALMPAFTGAPLCPAGLQFMHRAGRYTLGLQWKPAAAKSFAPLVLIPDV